MLSPASRRRAWLTASAGSTLAILLGTIAAPTRADVFTDFFRAVGADDDKTVANLLLRGMDANSIDDKGQTALTAAVRAGALRVVDVLLHARGVKLDLANRAGETPLMVAALRGDVALMQRLIDEGAEVNRTAWTPLHYAASAGRIEAVRLLIEQHAYIDAESPNKTTPLMMAARQRQYTALQLLLEEGADPTLRNDAGLTAADYAQRNGEDELAVQLRARAAEFTRRYRAAGERAPAPPGQPR